MVQQTFQNPIVSAVERAAQSLPGRTRTETGLLNCFANYPEAIYAIGNAPTALLALCEQIASAPIKPALVIGAPVGFISVVESKMALCQTDVAQIRVAGRKGGSPVAAAILNALMVLAWEQQES
jgi:precorrin-8X/cobalt-precorrin-8 methylmutase